MSHSKKQFKCILFSSDLCFNTKYYLFTLITHVAGDHLMFLSKFKISGLFFVLLSTIISLSAFAENNEREHDEDRDNKCKSTSVVQVKPYIVILGPADLMQVRVNLENYQPTTKEIKKYEVNFGDGFITINKTDVYHTYTANKKYAITVKTWDSKNVLNTYTENIDINSMFVVNVLPNTKVLVPVVVADERKINLNLTDAQALKLYKISLKKTSQPIANQKNKKCFRDYNVDLNGVDIFKEDEINCNTTIIEKFVRLNKANKLRFEAEEPRSKSKFSVEINAVELVAPNLDTTPPILTSNIFPNAIVKNGLLHISVNEASTATTYVWDNQQNLLNTLTAKEFDLSLTQGQNNLILQSIDSSGNKSAYLYLTNIIFDNVPAVLSTTLLTQYIYNSYSQTVSLIVNSNEPLQQLTVNNQNALMVSPTSFQFEILVNSPQTLNLNVKGFDLAGNETILALNPVFNIDNIPPNISVPLASNAFTNSSSFTVSVTDNSTFSTQVFNNGVLVVTSTQNSFSVPLSFGVNSFLIKSTDKYNNISSISLNNITYDNLPPIISGNNPQDFYFNSLPQNLSFSFSSNEPLQSFQINGQDIVGSNLQYAYNFSGTTSGVNSLIVKAIDLAGNVTKQTVSFNLNLDVTAPIVSIGAMPALTNKSQILASFVVTDANSTSTTIKVNGVNVSTVSEKNFSYLVNLSNEGQNTIEAVSTDIAGNVSQVATANVKKDSTPAVLSNLLPVDNGISKSLVQDVSGISNEQLQSVSVNGQAATLSADGLSFQASISFSDYGTKILSIAATDLSGNITNSQINVILKNLTAPVITTNLKNGYTNVDQISIQVSGDGFSNLRVTFNDVDYFNEATSTFVSTFPFGDAEHRIDVYATNSAGQETHNSYVTTLDTRAPFINLSGIISKTTLDSATISYNFYDTTPTRFRVIADQVTIFDTTESQGSFEVPLLTQGVHTVSVFAIDSANNMSDPMTFEILKDNTNPIVTILSPANGEYVDGNHFKVKARVDDAIVSMRANGRDMVWNDTEALWEMDLYAGSTEDFAVTVVATNTLDLIGETTVMVKPLLSPLVPALLGIYEDAINHKMLVKGAAGSTRPFLNLIVKSGIFSRDQVQADKNGSFMISLPIKDEYTVFVTDPATGQDTSYKLTRYNQQTILSGVVKDNNDKPLAGVAVTIGTDNMQVTTNEAGVFEFKKSDFPNSRVTGDQVITVDGRNVTYDPAIERPKKFSVTKLNFSMSYKQNNVIQNTIYLYPTYQDTATNLGASGGGEITSPEAQGVVLSVPSDVNAVFPSGAGSETVSMFTTIPEKITMKPPSSIQAKNIIVLEPSGTTFSDSVDLTIPNFSSFPPQTSMYFLLYNSKTGEWEIGGAGKVTDDGQSVKTDAGKGIRHFSDVLAIPTSPDILAHNLPNKPGADTFSGANATKIELPSFKVLGNSVSPSLIYKSAWAKPSTTITNIFNFAESDIALDPFTDSQTQNVKYMAAERKCWLNSLRYTDCRTDYKETYEAIKIDTEYTNLKAMISPQRVDMNLVTADINTPVRSFTNIPRLAQLSNFFELKNANDQYLPTGLYPYDAHYTITYDQLIMGTSRTQYYSQITGAVDETKPYERTIPNKIFGTDLFESLYVQNYRNSEVGQGWKIGGVQKIVNPNSSKIMIEEGDGAISTYDFDNTISTVVNFDDINGDATAGISLNEWPKFTFTDKTTKEIKSASPSGASFNTNVIGSEPLVQGTSSGHTYTQTISKGAPYQVYVCDHRTYFPGGNICDTYHYDTAYSQLQNTSCSQNNFTYKQDSRPSQFISTANGAYVLDSVRHSLGYVENNQYSNLVSSQVNISQNQFVGYAVPITTTPDPFDYYRNSDSQIFNNFLNSYSGVTTTSANVRSESFNYFADCNTNAVVQAFTSGSDIYSTSELNNPSAIIVSSDPNILMIANTGRSVITSFNVSTNETLTVAGNGTASDTGDNLLAVDAGIANPKGLAFDNQGNLFVSTGMGYIRKITTDGTITTVAGDPLNGLYVSEADPLKMKFNNPYGLAFDSTSNSLFVADSGYNRIVKIDFNTNIASTIAGNSGGSSDEASNNPLKISLSNPTFLKIDSNRNLIIVDSGNKKIRQMSLDKLSGNTEKKYLTSIKDFSSLVKKTNGQFERSYRDGRKEIFDAQGKNIQSVAANGLFVNFEYNDQNYLSKITFPNQDQVSYHYSSGKLDSITDIAGRVTYFNYNGLGQLTSTVYPDETSKQFEYDSNGLMTKETNQKGFYKNFEYNQFDRLEKIVDASGAELAINDSATNGMSSKLADGSVAPKNSGNNNDVMVDPNGNQISFTKDIDGYLYKITDPRGRTKTVKRDSEGRPLEITDVDGSLVQNKFDSIYGDLIEAKNVTLGITAKKSYNVYGQIISEVDPYGKISEKQYNQKLQLVSQIQPDGKYSQITYNALGLVTIKSDYNAAGALQRQTSYEYNQKGQLLKQTNLDGKFSTYTYDISGNILTSTANIVNSQTAVTSFQYDLMNHLKKVISPKNETTEYKYSNTGELIEIKDNNGKISSFEYNEKGKLVKRTDPLGLVVSMTYDANGNLLSETDAANQVKLYSYNSVNKITQIQTVDDLILYDYNLKDEVLGISNSISSVQLTRDAKQRITSETVVGNSQNINYPSHAISYDYSLNDLRRSMTSSFQSINYFYNQNNYQLTGVQNSFGNSFAFNYDEANRLTSMTRPGSQTDYSYDVGSSLTSIVHSANGNIKSSFEYQYDLRNYITQKRSPSSTLNYSYDSNGQLTNSSKVENSSDNEAFSYDALGNRLTNNGVSSAYDQASQRIQDDGFYTYLYDLNGNILAKNSKINGISYLYEYTALNQIKTVNIFPNANSISALKKIKYAYDPSGRRILKNVIDYQDSNLSYTKKFYFDDTNIIAELDSDNNLLATYTHRPEIHDDILSAKFSNYAVSPSKGGNAISEGQVLSDRIGSVYFVKDHVNSVTEILDASGNIIQKYEYSAFGMIKSIKNSANQVVNFQDAPIRTSFTFTGREYEPETKTYHFRARQYDPSIGRFLQQDPDPGKIKSPRSLLTKYAYVENTPTMFNDPTGKFYIPNPDYAHGNYCGSGATGGHDDKFATDIPIDGLDNTCKLHDAAYAGDIWSPNTNDNFWNPDYSKMEARFRTNTSLVSEGIKLAFTRPGNFLDGIGVAAWGEFLIFAEIAILMPLENIFRLLGL